MGYTHDTDFSQWIAPNQIIKTAGTWTDTIAANVVRSDRTPAAAGFSLFVPLLIPSNASALKGARLKGVELHYKIATAGGTAFTIEMERVAINAAGVVSGAALPISLDSAHASDALRRAVGDHRLVVSLDSPAWVGSDQYYWLFCSLTAAATTAFALFGAVANYDFRA